MNQTITKLTRHHLAGLGHGPCGHSFMLFPLAVALLLLSAAACQPDVRVEDDLDFELFDFELHTPYVVGADVSLHVSRRNEASVSGWTVETEDQATFLVDGDTLTNDGRDIWVSGLALAPGETRLLVRGAGGSLRASRRIRVAMPDRIALVPAGLIKVRGDEADPLDPAEPILALEGGLATFEVQYYAGSERLFGNNALGVSVDATGLDAYPEQTFIFENREWLRLSADATGTYEITLSVDGQHIATYDVDVVASDSIAQVEIEAEPARGARNEDLLYLLAHAYDSSGRDLWGVDFDWSIDDAQEPGEGDLFYYYYESDSDHVVAASRNGHQDEVVVFMSEGGVTSSNSIGCSTADAATGLPGLLLPLLLLLALVRRRRTQSSPLA